VLELRVGSAEQAVVWGHVPAAASASVLRSLRDSRLSEHMPQQPAVFAVVRADGSVLATATPAWRSGIFWSHDRCADGSPRLLIGVHPGAVVRARNQATTLDHEYVREFASGMHGSDRTPYEQVRWCGSGLLVQWSGPSTQPATTEWVGPDAWPAPTLEGPQAVLRYRERFDAVVSELIADDAPLAVMVSGGLDSSFLAATLAVLGGTRRHVHGFSHAPLPEAALGPRGHWDPDDSSIAALLETAHPGRITITRVLNHDLVQPLDAAALASDRSWMPTLNPANKIWMDQICAEAASLGARQVFIGQGGNASFSATHRYAAVELLAHGRIDRMAALASGSRNVGTPLHRRWENRVLRPLAAAARSRIGVARKPRMTTSGVPQPARPREGNGRHQHLRWMAGRLGNLPSSWGPRHCLLPLVDPFTTSGVLNLAASITPFGWSIGPDERGFARQVGAGRVPDDIRLRRRRGGQSWDEWYVIRNQRDRYIAEAHAVADTPALGGWVDSSTLLTSVDSWKWGDVAPPPLSDLVAVERLLSLAAFVRATERRLRALPTQR